LCAQQVLNEQHTLRQRAKRPILRDAYPVQPAPTGEAQVGTAVGQCVQESDLASNLDRMHGEWIERRRAKLSSLQMRRHQREWSERRLEEQIVVDADDRERVAVDQ